MHAQYLLTNLYVCVGDRPTNLAETLSCLLTPPSLESVQEAVTQLAQLGALQTAPSEVLTALGTHLAAMPMDAALGKALLYGCLLRCANSVVVQQLSHSSNCRIPAITC